MYNRYVRNDNGTYARIPQEDTHRPNTGHAPPPPHQETKAPPREPHHEEHAGPPPFEAPPRPQSPPPPKSDGLSSFLRHFLDQFHLDHVDTGDLLLLGLLFFLFREDADDELLVALGLLLIL